MGSEVSRLHGRPQRPLRSISSTLEPLRNLAVPDRSCKVHVPVLTWVNDTLVCVPGLPLPLCLTGLTVPVSSIRMGCLQSLCQLDLPKQHSSRRTSRLRVFLSTTLRNRQTRQDVVSSRPQRSISEDSTNVSTDLADFEQSQGRLGVLSNSAYCHPVQHSRLADNMCSPAANNLLPAEECCHHHLWRSS